MKHTLNLAIVVVSLLSFSWLLNAGSIDYPLVYDDKALVTERDSSLDHPPAEFFSTRHEGLGRHLTVLSIDLDRSASGSTSRFHVTNALLMGLCGVALYGLGLALGLAPAAALTGAAVFVAHPLHTAAVVPVSGRSELLAALFVLSATVLYIGSLRPLGYRRLALLCLLFFAGLASKENALVLLPLLLCYEGLQRLGRRSDAAVAPAAVDFRAQGALLLTAATWLALVYRNFATLAPVGVIDNPLVALPLLERVAQAASLLWQYACRLAWPWPQESIPTVASFAHSHTIVALLGWTTLLLGCPLAVRFLRLRVASGLLLLWFLLAFSSTANVFFPLGTAYSERLAFLPSAGPSLLFGALLFPLSRGKLRNAMGISIALLVLVVGASGYLEQARSWSSELHFHRQATAASPRSAKAHYDLGIHLAGSGKLQEALAPMRRAVHLAPGFSEGTLYLAETLVRLEQVDEAILAWQKYLALRPDDDGARSRLMATLVLDEDWSAAAVQARELVARGKPEFSELAVQLELEAEALSP